MTEVSYAWRAALMDTKHPTGIILSRQKFKQIKTPIDSDLSRGGYVIYPAKSGRVKTTLVATGAEVPLAVEIASRFKHVQVVSMLNLAVFKEQDKSYKTQILRGCVVAIEAASPSPWFEFADAVIGVDKFGESGDAESLYDEYGFNADIIVKEIKQYLK